MIRRLAVATAVLSVAAVTLAGPPAAAPAAPAGGQPPDVKAMMERNMRCMRELSAHASKVSFDRKDVEKYLAEWRSFDALGVDEPADDDPADGSGPSCVDLSTAAADPEYVAWARARGLDPKTWLLKSMRISLTYAKRRAPAEAAEMKRQMDAQRVELEKSCASMGPDVCRQMRDAFASGDEAIRATTAMWAVFPEPSRSEAALLSEYDTRLREASEGSGAGERGGPLDADDAPPEDDQE